MKTRRAFIKEISLTGGALIIGFHFSGCTQEDVVVTELNAWAQNW